METRIINEDTFYRIYDRNENLACSPKDDNELKSWLEKGKAPFLVWRNDTWYESTKRVWHKIIKVENVTRKVVEEIEEVEI